MTTQNRDKDNTQKKPITIRSKPLFPAQQRIVDDIIKNNIRYNIVNASRQFGKSTMVQQLMLYWSLNNPKSRVLYVSPTFLLGKQSWSNIIDGLQGSSVIGEVNKTDLTISFINGSEIVYRSATNPDTIRGGAYDYTVLDECAYMDRYVFESVIRQSMAVRGKQSVLVSTPKGRDWFHEYALRGMNEEMTNYSYNTGHYSENPYYNLMEVEDAKKTLPPAIFEQEYEARFVDAGGSVFPNMEFLSKIVEYKTVGKRFSAGLDLGRMGDYTVLTVLNEMGEVVYFYRVHQMDWSIIIREVIAILKKFHATCLIEVNNIGDIVYEEIYKQYRFIEPFVTTNQSKQLLIEDLIMSMSEKRIMLPSKDLNPQLHSELSTFSFKYSPITRKVMYGALQGFHDDCVISLALANRCRSVVKENKIYIY